MGPDFLAIRSRIFLASRASIPAADGSLVGELPCHFTIELGNYTVEGLAITDQGRACHRQWKLEVNRDRIPETVHAVWNSAKVLVLVDAASADWQATALSAADVDLPTYGLFSLLSRLSVVSVRLIVFNIDREAVLMRSGRFTASDMGSLTEVLKSVALGTIDYRSLRTEVNPASFPGHLIQPETGMPEKIVFFGSAAPGTRHAGNVAAELKSRGMPVCYYFEFRAYPVFAPAHMAADPIEQTVRQLNGRTLGFSNGSEFADAVDKVADLIGR